MKLSVLRFEQNGKAMYMTLMRAKDLVNEDQVDVDRWKASDRQGYQRSATMSRCRAFGRFISKTKGISPPSVLLSVRGKVWFTPKEGNYGVLEIPNSQKLWIVDGQHRIEGFKTALEDNPSIADFEVAVVILPLDPDEIDPKLGPRYEEAKQFVIVNRTQKGVRADLAERFLVELARRERVDVIKDLPTQVTRGIDWKPKAIRVTDILNERSDSPWYGRIRLPNEPRGTTTVSQKSFSDSLKPIITHGSFKGYNDREIAGMLARYWNAIKKFATEAFDDPGNHVILKTTGPYVLHELFPEVASFCREARLTEENMSEVLNKMEMGMTSEYWSSNGEAGLAGTSRKSFSILITRLREALEAGNEPETKPTRPFEL